jgi:acyl carrier protein
MKEKIRNVIIQAVTELNATLTEPLPIENGDECFIYRYDSHLDSISLVMLISDLESKLEDDFDITLTLANEKSMSAKNSPFSSVGRLTDYIADLIGEQHHA